MIYKTYGKTGKKVSAVGFGGMRFDESLSQDVNAQLLPYAFDKGINYFDTAPDYCHGDSELIFGKAMNQMKSYRDQFYVTSKGMPTTFDTADKARAAVEASLKRMNLEKLDFYFVWCIRKIEHYELAMKKGGQYEALLKCKEEGLIDHIVISTHLRGHEIGQILERNEFDGVLLGTNILNFPYRWEGIKRAHDLGLGVVAMNPLAGGAIVKHAEQLAFLGQGKETAVDAALRFAISCPQITVALNGFTTRDHIDQACRIADTCEPFTDEEINRIQSQVAEGMDSICTGCGYCLKTCPKDIPIASYMQYYNDKMLFGTSDEDMIKNLKNQHDWMLLADRKAEAKECIQCGQCEQACTQHLNIIERLNTIAKWEASSQA